MHEVELGVVIGQEGKFISEEKAMDHVLGYVLALDMTGVAPVPNQYQYKWLLTKGFDTATPISDFIPKSALADENNASLKLKVNGQLIQDGNTRDLLFKIPRLIEYISQYFTLEYGDLILTGTPLNNLRVKSDDTIDAYLNDTMAHLSYRVTKRS